MIMNNIYDYFDYLFPNPKCELNFDKDYELLIAVALSAQTTDKKVNEVTSILFNEYPSLQALKGAKIDDIKRIIKPIGTYNKKAEYVKQISEYLIDYYNGEVPKTCKELEIIPGVGHKTAQVVLGVLYNIPSFAVDTHVSRVSKRLGLAKNNDEVSDIERKMKRKVDKDRWIRTHHQMVLFGRYYCKSQNPSCDNCRLKECCKYKKNKA